MPNDQLAIVQAHRQECHHALLSFPMQSASGRLLTKSVEIGPVAEARLSEGVQDMLTAVKD